MRRWIFGIVNTVSLQIRPISDTPKKPTTARRNRLTRRGQTLVGERQITRLFLQLHRFEPQILALRTLLSCDLEQRARLRHRIELLLQPRVQQPEWDGEGAAQQSGSAGKSKEWCEPVGVPRLLDLVLRLVQLSQHHIQLRSVAELLNALLEKGEFVSGVIALPLQQRTLQPHACTVAVDTRLLQNLARTSRFVGFPLDLL